MSRAREFADLAGSADAGGLTGRNLIINGAMQVAQRGTSQSSVTATGYYCVDRFKVSDSISTLVTTVSQSTDAAAGFEYSKKIDVTTANASPSASEYFVIQQSIEAQDLEKLQYGTSAAKSLTLSFYVKSPKTGTHYAELAIPSGQFFSKPYTINSANTWEYKTLTFAGNTGQALVNSGTSAGINVNFWLVAGSTFTSGTYSEVWSNTNANRLVGQVNVLDNAANDFYLTGVQLELGDTATPFEHRSFGDELARCQRYYIEYGKDLNANGPTTFRAPLFDANTINSGYCFAQVDLPVDMRTSGTFTAYKATNGSGADLNNTNWGPFTSAANQRHIMIQKHTNSMTGNQTTVYLMFDMDAEL